MRHAPRLPSARRCVGRYSIWLAPAGAAARRLATAIARLARRSGSPVFEPHVTLLGGLRLDEVDAAAPLERLGALIRRGGPLWLTLRHIGGGPHYFRFLYCLVDGGHRLDAARRHARRLFGARQGRFRPSRPAFEPHVSLAYGCLPATARRRLAASLESCQVSPIGGQTFSLDRGPVRVHAFAALLV